MVNNDADFMIDLANCAVFNGRCLYWATSSHKRNAIPTGNQIRRGLEERLHRFKDLFLWVQHCLRLA